VHHSEGDLAAQLGETFNKMTQELRTQGATILVNASRPDRQPPRIYRGGIVVGKRRHHPASDASGSVGILNPLPPKSSLVTPNPETAGSSVVRTCYLKLDDMMKNRRGDGTPAAWCRARLRSTATAMNAISRFFASSAEQTQPSSRTQLYHHARRTLPNWFPHRRTLGVGPTSLAAFAHESRKPAGRQSSFRPSAFRPQIRPKVITEDKGHFRGNAPTPSCATGFDDIQGAMVDEFLPGLRGLPKPVIEGEDVADHRGVRPYF